LFRDLVQDLGTDWECGLICILIFF
jgi:hypothetical protein